MWLFPTKKEVLKELNKIKESFKERDVKIERLQDKIESNSLKIATLEGAYSILSSKSQYQSQPSLKPSQAVSGIFETKLMKRIRNNKKSLIMAEIIKLKDLHTIPELFDIIVREKGLCSKASFYRYLESLRSQRLIETEIELRQTEK